MYHCITGATGFQFFFPTLTGTLGYSNVVSLLLVAPPYVFMVFYSFGHSMTSDKFQMRYWFWMYPIPIVIVGCFIFMFTDSFGPKYFSLFLLNFAFTMNSTVSNPIVRIQNYTDLNLDLRLDRKFNSSPSCKACGGNGFYEQCWKRCINMDSLYLYR